MNQKEMAALIDAFRTEIRQAKKVSSGKKVSGLVRGDWIVKDRGDGTHTMKYFTGFYMEVEDRRLMPCFITFIHKVEDGYSVVYRKDGSMVCHAGHLSPQQVTMILEDNSVYSMNRNDGEPLRCGRKNGFHPVLWSEDYDGKSILVFMSDHPKTPFRDLKSVVENELGYIDANGIIHKNPNT